MSSKCTFCNKEMRNIHKDEVYDIQGKIVVISNIPALSCLSEDCQTEFYPSNVLSVLNVITTQFENNINQSFIHTETMINYPSLIFHKI